MVSQFCPRRHTLDSDGPSCPQGPSPKLQEAGCVTVDGAAQMVQCVVERDIGKFLRGKDGVTWAAGRKVGTEVYPPCVGVPSLYPSSSYLSNNTQDTLDPLGGVEAARISGHCFKNSANKVQVMDGVCPHGASKL